MGHHLLALTLLFADSIRSSAPRYDRDSASAAGDGPSEPDFQVDANDEFNFKTSFVSEGWGAQADIELRAFSEHHVEVVVSSAGQPHIIMIRDGRDDTRVWLSERAEETGMILDFLRHLEDDEVLAEARKNAACGVFKWGISAALAVGVVACCTNVVACFACTIVGSDTQKKIDGIDCNKECKPECPL